MDKLKSFDEFLERKFPESRRKAYYLMAIHEHLPRIHKVELKSMGWTKATDLAKVARREVRSSIVQPGCTRLSRTAQEEFKREVEKELTGRKRNRGRSSISRLYKSQLPVIEQALETAALMLGLDKSRGYCLEMICADFLAGANLDKGNPDALLESIFRFFKFLPSQQRRTFVEHLGQRAS